MLSGANVPMRPTKSRSMFTRFAKAVARWTGRPIAFLLACLVIVVWLATGPIFHFSDTWQLVINTGTTVVTFMMVFLIQSTQHRDAEAVQVKLDELLRVTRGAHNTLLDLEEMEDKELDDMHKLYQKIAGDARKKLRQGEQDTGVATLDTDED